MREKKIVFCPVTIGCIKVSSEDLDNLTPFSRFLIWALKSGYCEDEIITTIDLGRAVVVEEKTYLQKIGLIANNGKLTPAGLKYYMLSEGIKRFNDMQHTIIFNTYTGKIEEFSDNIILAKVDSIECDGNSILRKKPLPDARIACKKFFEEKFFYKTGIPPEFLERLSIAHWRKENENGESFLKFEADADGIPTNPLYYKVQPGNGFIKIIDKMLPEKKISQILASTSKFRALAAHAIRSNLSFFQK